MFFKSQNIHSSIPYYNKLRSLTETQRYHEIWIRKGNSLFVYLEDRTFRFCTVVFLEGFVLCFFLRGVCVCFLVFFVLFCFYPQGSIYFWNCRKKVKLQDRGCISGNKHCYLSKWVRISCFINGKKCA